MANRDHAKGASKSLNKTITEIMKFLGDDSERSHANLRPFLHEKIGDLAEHWFRRGFNRGHIESNVAFLQSDAVPKKLEYECSRTLSPGQDRELILKSTLKSKKTTGSRKSKSRRKKL